MLAYRCHVCLNNIAEVRVLAIRQIVETVGSVDLSAEFTILLLVAHG